MVEPDDRLPEIGLTRSYGTYRETTIRQVRRDELGPRGELPEVIREGFTVYRRRQGNRYEASHGRR